VEILYLTAVVKSFHIFLKHVTVNKHIFTTSNNAQNKNYIMRHDFAK